MSDPAVILAPSPDAADPASAVAPPHPMDRWLRTDHLHGELRRRTVRGGAVTMVSQGMKFALNLASTWVLFRLLGLGPADFGLVAMVVTVTGVINLFKDMGLLRAAVQCDRITHAQATALFWVGAAVGLGATVLAWMLAPAVAWFYGEPRLVPIMFVLGTGFLFGGLSVQHQALMQRQMQFTKLAGVDVAAVVVGTVAAVVAAGAGLGYWSLFGGNLTGFNVISYVQRHFDVVLVGRLAGAHAMGVYGKAFQLLMLPITQVNTPMSNIAVPALARLQNDPEQYRYFYRRSIELLSAVTMPIVALLFVAADEVIVALMGPQWLETVLVFRLLVPAAWIATFQVATNWVYLSLGNTDRQLRMILVLAPIHVAAYLVGAYLGTRYWGGQLGGAYGTALAASLSAVVLRYPAILYSFKGTPLTEADLFAAIWRPSLASLLAGLALWGLDRLAPAGGGDFLRLIVESAAFGVLYLGCWLVLPGGARFLAGSTGMLKELKGRSKPKPPQPEATLDAAAPRKDEAAVTVGAVS